MMTVVNIRLLPQQRDNQADTGNNGNESDYTACSSRYIGVCASESGGNVGADISRGNASSAHQSSALRVFVGSKFFQVFNKFHGFNSSY